MFVKMTCAMHRPNLLEPTMGLKSVSGHDIKVLGLTQISIDKARPIKVYVVDNIPHEMILGDDALRKGKCQIDYSNNNLLWCGEIWPISCNPNQGVSGLDDTFVTSGNPQIDCVIQQYTNVFSGKSDVNGFCDMRPISIETNSPPICQPAYRTALSKRKLVEEAIDDMLAQGVIRPSTSPWASPITLVPKKDGSTRFCVDYRRLNSVTLKDQYPLPVIQDIFDQVGGSAVFSTLDLKSGYWQIPVAERDIEKTAFRCHRGLFEFVRMPFGLANAPGHFQRTMDYVFSDLIGKTVMVYIDDIVVYSKNVEDHANHLEEVFQRLEKYGLRLKPSKCTFGKSEVKLLGYIVNKHGIASDPEKTKAIADLQPPASVAEVRSFLGMSGYYRQCIPSYAEISEPLVRLTRKYARFEWTDCQQRAFDTLKDILVSNEVMAHPQVNKPYKLYTDACDYAIGAILVQADNDGVERVVQYVSHQLAGPQLRWATIEKEAYAVVYAIGKLRAYLYGAKFTVFTDHKPLASLFTKEMQNTKIQRWGILLAEYGAKIEYRQGKNNIRADMLSRIKSVSEVAIIDTQDWIDPEAWPDDVPDKCLPILSDGLDLKSIAQAQNEQFSENIEGADSEDSDFTLAQGVLYSIRKPTPTSAVYPRLVLPSGYREQIIKRAHKDVGHMSSAKTLDRIREAYVWPGMRADVKRFISLCATCCAHQRRSDKTPMGDMPLPATPMQVVGMDLIGPFAESSQGNRYILTIIDHHSGWGEAYPIKNKTNHSVWTAFANNFIPRHGIPEILITDNGKEFTAKAWCDYLKEIGIDHRRTTPVHPQSNGKVERFNRTFKETLAKLVNNRALDWEDRVGDVLFAHRNSVSSVTGYTPFFLLYGRRSRAPLAKLLQPGSGVNHFGNRLDELSEAFKQARTNTKESRLHNQRRIGQRANADQIEVGDTVVIKAEERLTMTSRWDPQWEVTRVSGTTCWLRNQQTGKTKVLHREKVKLIDPNVVWDDFQPRPIRNPRLSAIPQQPADNLVTDHESTTPTTNVNDSDCQPNAQLSGETRSRWQGRKRRQPPPQDQPTCSQVAADNTTARSDEPLSDNRPRLYNGSTNQMDTEDNTEPGHSFDADTNMEEDPISPHFRKRTRSSYLAPSEREQKRARWDWIASVAAWFSSHC